MAAAVTDGWCLEADIRFPACLRTPDRVVDSPADGDLTDGATNRDDSRLYSIV